MVLNATFNNISAIYIMTDCFIGGEKQSIRRKPPNFRKSRNNFIT